MSFCFACHPAFADRDFFCSDNSSEIHGKEMFTAGKIAWFLWLSMCTGMHEIEFLLMMAFVLICFNSSSCDKIFCRGNCYHTKCP